MSFFGQGGFAQNLTGLLGDVFFQQGGMQPVFGPAVKQRQQAELEEQRRQRARMEGREDTQWEWQNKPKDPYIPDAEKQAQYYESIGDPETAADIRAKARMVPVQQADLNTGEVRYQYVRPTTLMGGVSAPKRVPQPGTVEEGYMFKGGDPADPSSWVPVGGGAGLGAPRPFP